MFCTDIREWASSCSQGICLLSHIGADTWMNDRRTCLGKQDCSTAAYGTAVASRATLQGSYVHQE